MRRLSILLGLPAMAASGVAQALATPVPIAEWGPGLSSRPELMSRGFGHAVFLPVDVDGDGDMDAVQLGSWDRSGLLTVTFNEGGGRFTPRVMPPARVGWLANYYLGVGDIDGDRDPDVVVPGAQFVNFGADRPWVHLNDGQGNFTLDNTRFPQSPRNRGNCVLCDVDRDGDLDAVCSGVPAPTIGGQLEVWLNDGNGFFTDASNTLIPVGTYANFVAAGDLDGDGLPDLALGSYSGTSTEPKRILWNDGTGHFSVQRLPPVNYVDEVHLFDADGDGDLDVLFSGGFKFLYRNDGSRALTQAPFPNDNQFYAYGPASIGDVDADGDLDVVLAGTIFQPFVLLNDGRGRFTESPGWVHGPWTQGINQFAFADLDGDGDQDAFAEPIGFVTAWNGAVFYNRHRQVWGPPTVARGATYSTEITGRPFTTFALAAHAAILDPPWSLGALGAWWLDPLTMVPLPSVRCDLLGAATLPIPIPNVPSLAGKTLFLQGMDLGTWVPQLVHATGYWAVRIQ